MYNTKKQEQVDWSHHAKELLSKPRYWRKDAMYNRIDGKTRKKA